MVYNARLYLNHSTGTGSIAISKRYLFRHNDRGLFVCTFHPIRIF